MNLIFGKKDLLKNKNKDQASVAAYSTPGFKSTGACLFFIEGNMPKNTIKELIHNRIVQANTRLANGHLDRFTQRLLHLTMFGYSWIDCGAAFNLDEHIVEPRADTMPPLQTSAELQAYVCTLVKTHKFRLDAPLWSLYYIKNFGQSEKTTVVLFIFHQCMSDGLSLMRLFFKGIVDNRNAIDVKPRFAYFSLGLSLAKQLLFGWSDIFGYVCLKRTDRNPINACTRTAKEFKKLDPPVVEPSAAAAVSEAATANGFNQTLVWSEPFDIMLLNRLKLVTRSRMNELLISIVTGILRTYLQDRGINSPRKMHCVMPVHLASNKFPFRVANHASITSFSVPVDVEGCVPRLWSVKTSMAELKRSGDYLFVHFLLNCLFYVLPSRMAYGLCASVLDKSTVVASTLGAGDANLSTVSVCNRSVKSIIFFYPCVASVPVSVSIMTYGDEVRLALLADATIITKPSLITDEFIKQVYFHKIYFIIIFPFIEQ
jgi:hypothetical protein